MCEVTPIARYIWKHSLKIASAWVDFLMREKQARLDKMKELFEDQSSLIPLIRVPKGTQS